MGTLPLRGLLAFSALALCAAPSFAADDQQEKPQTLTPPPGVQVDRSRAIEKQYVPPPVHLKNVGGHWTPYDPPTPPEGAEVYTIVAGDSLWRIAGAKYGDPYLWPIVWDANRYITQAHWIYPGDPLVLPTAPQVVEEQGPAPAPAPPPAPFAEEAKPAPKPVAKGPALFAAADAREMNCAPQLLEVYDPGPLTISGREETNKTMQGQGDVVYLSAGKDMGIQPGAEYVVVRSGPVVKNPDTRKPMAVYVMRFGRVRVLAVQENSATAEITFSCDDIHEGDHLIPYREMQAPLIERIPLAKLASPNPGRLLGVVAVLADPRATIAGAGHLVGIDVNSHAGVTGGDRVLFFHPGVGNAPRDVFAQGVILFTNGGGSIVKVLESVSEVEVGDKVDVR